MIPKIALRFCPRRKTGEIRKKVQRLSKIWTHPYSLDFPKEIGAKSSIIRKSSPTLRRNQWPLQLRRS
jgi:hypothetical protein